MNEDTILLLDFDPASSQCMRLQEILAPALHQRVGLHRESVEYDDADLRDAEVRSILQRTSPKLVFLILPGFPSRFAPTFGVCIAADGRRQRRGNLVFALPPTAVAMRDGHRL